MFQTGETLSFKSSRFGEVTISRDKVIHVPEGIIGFPEYKSYALLDPSEGSSIFLWLHSVDSPELAFIVTDPRLFVPEYSIDSSEPSLERIGALTKTISALFAIVTIPKDNPDKASINLLAPLLLFDDNVIYQVVLEKASWPLRHYLIQEKTAETGSPGGEVGG